MYAQIGVIVFERLAGWDGVGEQDDAVVTQYRLLTGKPGVEVNAAELRELSVTMRLHQRFIDVKNARLQLRAYKDNGTAVKVVWGNGDVEGTFLVTSIATAVEEQLELGQVVSATLNVVLLEVPDAQVLNVEQESATKVAVGIEGNVGSIGVPVVAVEPLTELEVAMRAMAGYISVLGKYAGVIGSLVYGGRYPADEGALSDVLAKAKVVAGDIIDNYTANGSRYDAPNSNAVVYQIYGWLDLMEENDPVEDAEWWLTANETFQGKVAELKQNMWAISARVVMGLKDWKRRA